MTENACAEANATAEWDGMGWDGVKDKIDNLDNR